MAAAAVLLALSVAGAMQWRGRQYQALGRQYVQQQAAVFREAMPGQRVPASIKARLTSERRRLEALGGEVDGAAPAAGVSALAHLRAVLANLPADVRWRILDLNIQSSLIRVDGQALSHADAEGVASQLRQAGLYEVDPPKTQALRDGGVSFVFLARPIVAAKDGAP